MIQLPAVLPRSGVKERAGQEHVVRNAVQREVTWTHTLQNLSKGGRLLRQVRKWVRSQDPLQFQRGSPKHTSSIMGAVKETITEPVLSYEKKGADVVDIRNCVRQLWYEDIPIKLSHDDHGHARASRLLREGQRMDRRRQER
jgi:hypothetical protein